MKNQYKYDCNIAQTLNIIGDKWSLLILHELSIGHNTYKAIQEGLEGIPTNLLSNRLKELEEDGFPKAKKFTVQQLIEELGYNFDQCGYPHEEEEILAPLDLIHRYEEQRASLNAEIDRVLAEITAILEGAAQ